MEFAARLVAATRADRDYLRGPVAADPLAALSTPGLQQFLADPANADARSSVEAPISGAGNGTYCGPLSWIGPGVVLGPQTWSALPGADGADLQVVWEGTMGYALADAQGAPEPWGLDARGAYGLVRTPDGWALDSWDDTTFGSVNQGWRHEVPLPDGYLADPDAPQADPAALDAVRAAAEAWGEAQASEMTVGLTTDDPDVENDSGETVTGQRAEAVAAPARGDASADVSFDGADGTFRWLWLDQGRRSLIEATGGLEPKPGRTIPDGAQWTERDATAPASVGSATR